MLSKEELQQLTGGEEYRLEDVRGGFQGRHAKLICGRRVYFIKAEGSGGYQTGAFRKEPALYRELLPALSRHTKKESAFWPKLWLAREGLLVLEDLAAEGWLQTSVFAPHHIRAVLTALADFHGASMLLDSFVPLLDHYPEALVETYFEPSPALRTWESFKGTARKIYSKYFPGRQWEAAVALMDETPELAKPSTQYRNCLCHGDLWSNNIFFKYFTSGVADKVCFVDFAQVRYCPPATDVLLFLRVLQVDDIDGYLRFYHSKLVERVPSFGLQEFLRSCSAMDRFAFCVAPLYVYLTKLPPAVIERITQTPAVFSEFAMGEDGPAFDAMEYDRLYRERIIRAFTELLEFAESEKKELA